MLAGFPLQGLERMHHFLDRQKLLLLACTQPELSPADEARLKRHGLGSAALGDNSVVSLLWLLMECAAQGWQGGLR